MAERVTGRNQIYLNDTYFPVRGQIQSVLSSIYPGKVVIGDSDRDSNPNASSFSLTDFRGGIGLREFDGAGSVDRLWWGAANIRYRKNLLLPPLATTTAASGLTGIIQVNSIVEYRNTIYADFGGTVYEYDDEADSWTIFRTLTENSTDAIVFNLNGTDYMVFAHRNAYDYYDGSSWAQSTTNAQFLALWDDALWGIDWDGQLWNASTLGSESNSALLPLESGSVTDLFVGRDATGEPILYAMTKVGLWAHDAAGGKFVATEMGLPNHPENGKGSVRWRGTIRIPAGFGIYRYQDGTGTAVISVMGPDRDDGVPSTYKGTIRQLAASHNEMFALVDAVAETPALGLDLFDSFVDQGSAVVEPDTGYSYILSHDDIGGWEVEWLSGASEYPATSMAVASAYDNYRLWFGQNGRVHYIDLEPNLLNPNEVTTYTYAAAGSVDAPWFTAGQVDVTKTALRVRVDVSGASANEKVTVSYATDYGTSFTAFTAITSNGTTTFPFPNSTTPTGTDFRAIQFRVALARGSTTTNSPSVRAIVLEYRKKLTAKAGFSFEVDLSSPFKNKSPKELRASLRTAVEKTTLAEFTFRDDDGDTRNYYVDVVSASNLEETGHDERGTSRVSVSER